MSDSYGFLENNHVGKSVLFDGERRRASYRVDADNVQRDCVVEGRMDYLKDDGTRVVFMGSTAGRGREAHGARVHATSILQAVKRCKESRKSPQAWRLSSASTYLDCGLVTGEISRMSFSLRLGHALGCIWM